MYGSDKQTRLIALNDLQLDEMKEIELSPQTATVKAEHDESWVGETKDQLVMPDQGWGKKWITSHVQTSWIEIHFNERVLTVCGIGFVTANDCEHRDPKKITISYFDEEEEDFKESIVVRPQFNHERHKLYMFKVPACQTKAFKFEMSHDGGHEQLQLCQIRFYGDPEELDEK